MSARHVLVRRVLSAVLGVLLFVLGWRMFSELSLALAFALAGVVMTIVALRR